MTDSDASAVIELHQVSCRFGRQHVLRRLDVTVRRGETLVIIGESGCGKSVTMKVMMQLLQATSGTVHWYGQDVRQMNRQTWRNTRLKFGYLFQGAALFDSLSVFENVAFGLRENRTDRKIDLRQTVLERLEDVGLAADVADRRPAELSGGMQKRVALARALALNPEVMFYDEPTTGLDPVTSRRIDDLIAAIRQRHRVSSVIVTHDMKTVESVADRVIMLAPCRKLDDGESQILFEGTVSDLFSASDPRIAHFVRGGPSDASTGQIIQESAAA